VLYLVILSSGAFSLRKVYHSFPACPDVLVLTVTYKKIKNRGRKGPAAREENIHAQKQ
jgi:hypothetical protein